MRPSVRSVAFGVTSMLALAACGSDGDSGDSGGSDSDSGSGTVKVMAIGQFQAQTFAYPEMADAIQAVLDKVNEDGGINGTTVELEVCNDEGDTNIAASCARQAATEQMAAVIGSITLHSPAITPLLEAANIPYIGALPLNAPDFQSPISYPVDGGTPTASGGMGITLVETGCTNVGILNSTDAAAEPITQFITAGVESAGGEVAKVVLANPAAPDYTAQVRELLDGGAECLAVSMPPAVIGNVIGAVRQSPQPDTQIAATVATLPAPVLEALGPAAEGIIGTQQSFLPGEQTPTLIADLSDVVPDGVITTPAAIAWTSATAFVEVASQIEGEITNESLIEQLDQTSDLTLETYPEPIDFTQENPAEDYPRMFNTTTQIFRVEDGAFVPHEEFEPINVQDLLTE
jgi:ABC-type branched-subunit amino acid transport system substrate-binding protein